MKFKIILSLLTISIAFMAVVAFKNQITPEKCAELGFPVMQITTDSGKQIKSKEKYESATFILQGGKEALSGNCKIRGHGNTTWNTRELYKKPYLLKLDKEREILGMPKNDKWLLIANTADKSQLRNAYASYLASKIWNKSGWVPRYRWVSLFLNNKYQGLYTVTEKVEIAEGRIQTDTQGGGVLYEVNSHLNRAWNFTTSHGEDISIRRPEGKSQEEYILMQKVLQEAEDSLFAPDFDDLTGGWRRYFDEDSLIDWFLTNEFTKNHDARFQSSCFMYFDPSDGKIHMGPVWDFDISCGNISWNGCDKPQGEWVLTASWYGRLFEDKNFVRKFKDRWLVKSAEIKGSIDWIQKTADYIRPAVEMNDSVWHNIGNRQWPHAPGWKKRKTYQSEVDYLKNWLCDRFDWINENIDSVYGLKNSGK